MADTRAEARSRMLAGLPPLEPVLAIEGLSEGHRIVINHWFSNGCRSKREACIAAGMSPNSAADVFRRAAVQAEILRRRDRLERKTDITAARIIEEFGKIAFSNLGDMLEIQADGSAWIDMAAISEDQKAALAEYHVETYQELGDEEHPGHMVKKSRVKFHDKKAALDSLARINGMFKDKLEVSVGLTLSDKVQQARERLRGPTIEGELA